MHSPLTTTITPPVSLITNRACDQPSPLLPSHLISPHLQVPNLPYLRRISRPTNCTSTNRSTLFPSPYLPTSPPHRLASPRLSSPLLPSSPSPSPVPYSFALAFSRPLFVSPALFIYTRPFHKHLFSYQAKATLKPQLPLGVGVRSSSQLGTSNHTLLSVLLLLEPRFHPTALRCLPAFLTP